MHYRNTTFELPFYNNGVAFTITSFFAGPTFNLALYIGCLSLAMSICMLSPSAISTVAGLPITSSGEYPVIFVYALLTNLTIPFSSATLIASLVESIIALSCASISFRFVISSASFLILVISLKTATAPMIFHFRL